MIKICENCGNEFESNYSKKRFCCRKCYNEFIQKNRQTKKVTCPICGNEFHQKRIGQIYCCNKCKMIAAQNRIECVCEYCGKSFERIVSEVNKNTHHYCSNECRNNAKHWNDSDIQILKENYGILSYKQISELLSRKQSESSIRSMAINIGLTTPRDWSNDELKILKDNYSKVPFDEILRLLPNRTKPAILGQARQNNLKSYFYLKQKYSEEDNEYLKQNYLSKSNNELAEHLGRSENAIAQHLWNLGLIRPAEDTKYQNYRSLVRFTRQRMVPWRNNIRERNNYVCSISGVRSNIIVHHTYSFNLIFQEAVNNLSFPIYEDMSLYTQKMLDEFVDEVYRLHELYDCGVCVTESIHKEFHKKYGNGYNTKEQWEEFVQNYN